MGTGYFNKVEDKKVGTGYFTASPVVTPTTQSRFIATPEGGYLEGDEYSSPMSLDVSQIDWGVVASTAENLSRPIGAAQNGLAWLASNISPAPNAIRASNLLLQTTKGKGRETLEAWKKNLSLVDAIKRGWSGKGVQSDVGVFISQFVPNEMWESTREKIMSSSGAGKWALFGAELVSDIVVDWYAGFLVATKITTPIRKTFQAVKISSNEGFARNAARTMKNYLGVSQDIKLTDEDMVKLFFKNKGVDVDPNNFVTPIRKDPALVKELTDKHLSSYQEYLKFEGQYGQALKHYNQQVANDLATQKFYGVQDGKDVEIIYRGQAPSFDTLQTVEGSDIAGNILFGKGVFTTTDKKVAEGYGSNVFRFKKPKEKIFDIWDVPAEDLSKLGFNKFEIDDIIEKREVHKSIASPESSKVEYENWLVETIQEKVYGGSKRELNTALIMDRVIPEITKNPRVSDKELIDLVRNYEGDLSYAINKAREEIIQPGSTKSYQLFAKFKKDNLVFTPMGVETKLKKLSTQKLQELGYQWWKHKGGIRAGGDEHDVYVALSDEVLQAHAVKPSEFNQLGIIERAGMKEPPPTTVDSYLTRNMAGYQNQSHLLSEEAARYSASLYQADAEFETAKLASDMLKNQLTLASENLMRSQSDLTAAKMGRQFMSSPESAKRALRESYIEAFENAFNLEIKQAKLARDAKAVVGGEKQLKKLGIQPPAKTPRSWMDVELPDDLKVPTGFDMKEHIKKLTLGASNGKTDDIAKLSQAEFQTVFENVEMFSKNKMLAQRLGYFDNWFAPAFRVFEVMRMPQIYHALSNQAMKSMAFNTDAKMEWAYHLKNVGLNPRKKYAADSSNPVLRRVFRYADGLDPSNPEKYIERIRTEGYNLTDEQKVFIRDITTSPEQTEKELKMARYANDKAAEMAELGIAQKKLYRPNDYKEGGKFFGQDIPEGAVPIRSNYITHIIEPLLNATLKEKVYGEFIDEATQTQINLEKLKDIADFFDATGTAAKKVKIEQLLLRQGVQEGLIENADHAFKTMLYNESNKFFLEPGYKSAMDLAEMTGNKDVIRYTTDWINTGVRGIPKTKELEVYEPIAQNARKMWNSSIGRIFEKAQLEEKDRAFKAMSNHFRRHVYSSAMGFNITSVLKNLSQVLLDIPVLGIKATIHGISSLAIPEARECLKYSNMILSKGIAIHEIDMSHFTRIEKAGSWLFRNADQWLNTGGAFNGALYKSIMNDKNAINTLRTQFGYTPGDIRSFWKGVSEMLPTGDLIPHQRWADEIAKMTQYSAMPWDMPKALWTPAGKLWGQFMMWPMNYFKQYLPRLWDMGMLGKGPMGDLPYHKRIGLIKHVVGMELIAQVAEYYTGIDLGYMSVAHAPIKLGHAVYDKVRYDEDPERGYISSPFPTGLAPFYQLAVEGVALDVIGRGMSGKFPVATNVRKGLIQTGYPKTTAQGLIDFAISGVNMARPGIAPGGLLQKGEDVFVNKTKSPLELVGIKTKKKDDRIKIY